MKRRASAIGPVLYGSVFVIGVPTVMVLWARATSSMVGLRALHVPELGIGLLATGLALSVAGMHGLRAHGHGLPMNAYPPPVYVDRGIYRFIGHPIYVGFGMTTVGLSLLVGSASGLWLVSPVTVLAMVALVMGYERHDLRRRFGDEALQPPLLSLPSDDDRAPTGWARASVFVLVFLPWTVAYEAVFRLGVPPGAVEGFFAFERKWPVLVWTEAVYTSVYLLVVSAPLLTRTNRVLRHLSLTGLTATVVVTLIYLTVPVVAPPRPFTPDGILGGMLELERAMSHTVAAFPAFHVIWTLTAAEALAVTFPRFAAPVWLWAGAIAVSCVTTGMHALADVALAGAMWPLLRGYGWVWGGLRSGSEAVANSWREWRWGRVRLVNHGLYAGVSGAIGCWIGMSLAGPDHRMAVMIVCCSALLGAALWAQRLEGSSTLSRPFGYFGSLVGGAAAAIVAGLLGAPVLLVLAALATAAPWIQAIGRLRCLVQGCCHGAPASDVAGIRYRVPNSRVVALANLGDVPLHPTPLYSILGNVVIGVLLARLWTVGAATALLVGLYFVLVGLARFVEESFRGEPQVPVLRGLRLYQWAAIGLFAVGIAVSSFSSAAAPDGSGWLFPGSIVMALAFGLLCTLAMGLDFPDSSRRYARLTG